MTSEDLLGRLPAPLRRIAEAMATRWPGRIALRSAAGLARIEIFDRSMTIAAQFFTSVFPVLIMAATWLGTDKSEAFANSIQVPPQTRAVLDDAVAHTSGFSAFGLFGTLVVLISATSLSRAFTRAFVAIWGMERVPTNLRDTWRWVAAVLVLALSMVLAHVVTRVSEGLPPPTLWSSLASAALFGAIAAYVPWLLLSGRVAVRSLTPGAVIFAVCLFFAHPVSIRYLGVALGTSAKRFGSIGVAFTYLTWLYAVSFGLLGTAVIGQVIATDDSPLGRLVRTGRLRPSGDAAGVDIIR